MLSTCKRVFKTHNMHFRAIKKHKIPILENYGLVISLDSEKFKKNNKKNIKTSKRGN